MSTPAKLLVKATLLVVLASFCGVWWNNDSSSPLFSLQKTTPASEQQRPTYTCPATDDAVNNDSDNDKDDKSQHHNYNEAEVDEYSDQQTQLIWSNLTHFVEHFRDIEYDLWTTTYREIKPHMVEWKKKHFQVESGATIYESAMGIGLNLVMTTEILAEEYGVHDLVVYGNEYLARSAELANRLFDEGIFTNTTQKGAFCVADSANLSHVPSNSFDVVFTGYISPVWDPLGYGDHWRKKAKSVCKDAQNINSPYREYAMRQLKQMDAIQEDWYKTWVGEMIRIAKPGAKVVVEQVSRPFCDSVEDFGGVDPEFWKRQVQTEAWPIEKGSLDFAKETLLLMNRYHVAMRKLSHIDQ